MPGVIGSCGFQARAVGGAQKRTKKQHDKTARKALRPLYRISVFSMMSRPGRKKRGPERAAAGHILAVCAAKSRRGGRFGDFQAL
ncbi:hypothetical protein [Caballeronia calidae]|uniref:hypothetical protein n=1 Tax=Caballeronia calidae TaxID=1777139 RepID=UPI0012FE5FB6|nr:hypothetical protein [Caballeronia calidae]